MNGFENEVRFEIVEKIGVITEHDTGWRRELNVVAWNGNQPKYDIRDWNPDYTAMSRGLTFTEDEMRSVTRLLKARGRNRR